MPEPSQKKPSLFTRTHCFEHKPMTNGTPWPNPLGAAVFGGNGRVRSTTFGYRRLQVTVPVVDRQQTRTSACAFQQLAKNTVVSSGFPPTKAVFLTQNQLSGVRKTPEH